MQVAPRTYRSWRTNPPAPRTVSDAGIVDPLRGLRTGGPTIVGWSASATKDVAFVKQCLSMALWRRDHTGRPVPSGMIHHSDAGSIHVDPVH